MIIEPAKPIRVVLEEQDDPDTPYLLREIGDQPAPEATVAVFILRQPDFELILRVPTGQRAEGEGARAWRDFLHQFARDYVVGWENVFSPTGEPVAFRSEYLTDGTVTPAIANALVGYLMAEAEGRRRAQMGGAGSRSTRGPRRISGEPGADQATAEAAPSSEQKEGSAQPERPTA